MNGLERTTAALRGTPHDRVPVMLHNFQMAARLRGITMAQYRSDDRLLAECMLDTIERFDVDGLLVDVDTCTLAGAVGVPIDFPDHEPARCSGPLLADWGDLDRLEVPDLESYDGVRIWRDAVQRLVEQVGREVFVRGNCDQCPFSLASMIRSPQNWMLDLLDPALRPQVERLLQFCTQVTNRFIELMAATGAHGVSNGDSTAGPEMISPGMYRELAAPYERQVVALAHRLDKPYVLHICGDTSLILADMLATGADAIELDYKTDVAQAHALMRDRCTFIGNLDPSGVLALGTVDDVARETARLVELFADTPRFILNAGCAIPPDTPDENIRTMIRVSRGE